MFETAEGVGRWSPRDLFLATYRQAVLDLSSGKPLASVQMEAGVRFRQVAKDPGILAQDPWVVAGDFVGALKTSLEAQSRTGVPVLTLPSPVSLTDCEWQPTSFKDEAGVIHRWAVVEDFSDDSFYREVHSWGVAGDMAVLAAPMELHFIELGYLRNGRLHSPWARAFAHPSLNVHRFQKEDGGPLGPSWKSIWFSETRWSTSDWVDQMQKDHVTLGHDVSLKELAPESAVDIMRQISQEARRLKGLVSIQETPMSRPACDFPTPCPFQDKCFI